MAKIKTGSIKMRMWDNTSTAPKDKDGNPVRMEEFDVRFNKCLMYDKRKR